MEGKSVRIVISGAGGLIGWHAHVRLHAANCAAQFKGETAPFDIVALNHTEFDNDAVLLAALQGAQAVLHFAGVNRAPDSEIEAANPAIATRLADACNSTGIKPHIVYANSTHATSDTPYGRSKRIAGEVLDTVGGEYTDLVLPHIFGEGARPFYNNVTATLIAQIIADETPNINPDGRVQLLHAGAAAQFSIDAAIERMSGRFEPAPHPISVPDLFVTISGFHKKYLENIYPDLSDPFARDLFNCYRAASHPDSWPRPLDLHTDLRGTLFEAVKGGGGGQSFLSSTKPFPLTEGRTLFGGPRGSDNPYSESSYK